MTISWTMVVDFTPVFAVTTGAWNYSFAALQKTKECVIAIPAVDLLDKVVGVGTCSGADTDKFKKFMRTPVKGKHDGETFSASLRLRLRRTSLRENLSEPRSPPAAAACAR